MYPDSTGTCTQEPETWPKRRVAFWRERPYPEHAVVAPAFYEFGVNIVDQWYDRLREVWIVLVSGPTLPTVDFGNFPYMLRDEQELQEWCEEQRRLLLVEWLGMSDHQPYYSHTHRMVERTY